MILAIETSSPRAGLALWDPARGELVCEEIFSTNRAHNSVIFGFADKLLKKCDRNLSGIVIGLGPGSYSGVRVGIALANGLGLAMGVEALGVSSLLAYGAANLDSATYAVIGDARRKTRFVAIIRDGKLEREPELVPGENFPARLEELLRVEQTEAIFTPDQNVAHEIPAARLSQPQVSLIARIGAKKINRGKSACVLEPHYLRPPYITTPKKRSV